MTEQPPALTPADLEAALTEMLRYLPPAPIVTRFVCAPDVVGVLHDIADHAPPQPAWKPPPLTRHPGVPIVIDASMQAGQWRMLDQDGGVVRQGTTVGT